uniref:HDC07381 n=1 Tax=Drosophila melanogaster TaxID=7227 RepID=Q6IG36_DROME|nr:TPA_inf: HDC07381 [Drosophila melanogaster]
MAGMEHHSCCWAIRPGLAAIAPRAEAAADSGSETGATTPQCSAYPWGEMMLPAPAPAPAVADPHLWPL